MANEKQDREARLAEALRQNLHRRKAQSRARKLPTSTTSASAADLSNTPEYTRQQSNEENDG